MGDFGKAFRREVGKNTGKFVSNVIFGDKHSTPYRRVDDTRSKERLKTVELQNKMHVRESSLRTLKATQQWTHNRANQLYAVDGAVLSAIDKLNADIVPDNPSDIIAMLSNYAVHLKSTPFEKQGDEANIRNKYLYALMEKYRQCLMNLRSVVPDHPQLQYFTKVLKEREREIRMFKFKKKSPIIIPAVLVGVMIVFRLLAYIFTELPFVFLLLIIVSVVAGVLWIRNYIETSNFFKKQKHEMSSESRNLPPIPSSQSESNIINLDDDHRIAKSLSRIWMRYKYEVNSDIMSRKPLYASCGVRDCMLFVGINPSYDPNEDLVMSLSANGDSLVYDSWYKKGDAPDYFKKLEIFSSECGLGYTHMNLLYIRENNRDLLFSLNSGFIEEQLKLTYETIMLCQPKVIIFFTDYCRRLIFNDHDWINQDADGMYRMGLTHIPVFFSDDVTILNKDSKDQLIQKILKEIAK